jgi:ArsR family transcriptional regulator, arsenate/arsenite/antimonite-responsive transcriptional repressor
MGDTWKALADGSRRQILLLLRDGEKTPSEIAENFEFTLPALSTHLRVLREAELVGERKVGQRRYYSLNREKMTEMMSFFDEFWEDNLSRLKRHVESRR